MVRDYNFKPTAKICRHCGTDFIGHSNKLYCSTSCCGKVNDAKRRRQFAQTSNLEFFLKEKLSLASNRGKHAVNINFNYLQYLWNKQEGLCALTKIPMTYIKGSGQIPTNVSMDRIDSNKPYEIGNVQLVCAQVNFMKHQLNLEQLKFWCGRILNG